MQGIDKSSHDNGRSAAKTDVTSQTAAAIPQRLSAWTTRASAPLQRSAHGLPPALQAGVESLSGFDLSDVTVHRDSAEPAQLQALAFARGDQIYLGPGQESHLPHEAWHVVQQRQGRVRPTLQLKGTPINDDTSLEREADAKGRAALSAGREKVMQHGEPLAFNAARAHVSQRAVVVQRGAKASKVDDSAVFEQEYATQVEVARAALQDHLNKVAFGTSPTGSFDAAHWEKVDDASYHFALRCKSRPSEALRALVAHPERWSFDCAEFVQVCNLYATMETSGDEAVDGTPLVLRQHDSTHLKGGGVTFRRPAKGERFEAVFPKAGNGYVPDFIGEDRLLLNLPVGSRVCFKNPAAPDTPFRNENAVVTGPGVYAAHPMGNGLSAANIVDRLVHYNEVKLLGGDDHGRAQIFVSEVEIYASIPSSDATLEALGLTRHQERGFL